MPLLLPVHISLLVKHASRVWRDPFLLCPLPPSLQLQPVVVQSSLEPLRPNEGFRGSILSAAATTVCNGPDDDAGHCTDFYVTDAPQITIGPRGKARARRAVARMGLSALHAMGFPRPYTCVSAH